MFRGPEWKLASRMPFGRVTQMMKKSLMIALTLLLSSAPRLLSAAAAPHNPERVKSAAIDWRAKVAPAVLSSAASGQTEFFVSVREKADLSGAAGLRTKGEKGRYVFEKLTETAKRSQAPLLATLNSLRVPYESFWIVNIVRVWGGMELLQTVAMREDVLAIHEVGWGKLVKPVSEAELTPSAVETVGGNLTHIRADQVWAKGVRGQGAVVAGADTGVEWTHPALQNHYRGWNGTVANHNYNWHDAISNPNLFCPGNSPEPCDDDELLGGGHGSHTVGTMIGDDGAANQIGLAPDAKWIACRNMNNGVGVVPTYLNCMEWFLAPTNIAGQNPDPSKAPHVINNSWACVEGCPPQVLQAGTEALRDAGIVYVASAGNDGSDCNTIAFAPAVFLASFTVGASAFPSDLIAGFSSRGNVLVLDPANPHRKPDVTAPGVSVRSSLKGGTYGNLSGTSMSGPHVAGLVALVISADPSLAGNVDRIECIIEKSAVPRITAEGCGGDTASIVPNNTYGYGRIDALMAYELVTPLSPQTIGIDTAGSGMLEPGETITVAPRWLNPRGISWTATGVASALNGPPELTLSITDANASYGSIASGTSADCASAGDCYSLSASTPSSRPDAHWDAGFTETMNSCEVQDWTLHIGNSFTDVPSSFMFYREIETLLHNNVTLGCTTTSFCKDSPTSREQMAAFIARSELGSDAAVLPTGMVGSNSYSCTSSGNSLFTDVDPTNYFCRHIHYIASRNITLGCGGTLYCPTQSVPRIQMAMFLTRAVAGSDAAVPSAFSNPSNGRSYDIPAGNRHFTDLIGDPNEKHANYMWALGITDGCSDTTYCPSDLLTRGQMARFLVRTYELTLD